jgi:hypothetical protein
MASTVPLTVAITALLPEVCSLPPLIVALARSRLVGFAVPLASKVPALVIVPLSVSVVPSGQDRCAAWIGWQSAHAEPSDQ